MYVFDGHSMYNTVYFRPGAVFSYGRTFYAVHYEAGVIPYIALYRNLSIFYAIFTELGTSGVCRGLI